jgi:hypothetical protein
VSNGCCWDAPGTGRMRSLWDIMRRLSISRLMTVVNLGATAAHQARVEQMTPGKISTDPMTGESRDRRIGFYVDVESDCLELELIASGATVRKILRKLQTDSSTTYHELSSMEVELEGRLSDELRKRMFMVMSFRESQIYDEPRKGWHEIIVRFPDTLTDVEEASKCFALSRYAAAVFHSLQVVEVGLIELGKAIGVSDPKSGWTATTHRLNAIIKKGHEARTPFEREHFHFFEQMQGTIEGLKNAWRNKVSHAQGRLALMTSDFTPDIAEEILFATRAFMRRLATEIPPPLEPDA